MSDLKAKLILEAIDRITQPVKRMTDHINRFAAQMGQAFRRVGEITRGIGKSMSDIGQAMTLKISTPLLGLGIAAVRTTANFESLRASLKTMTGSQEKANIEFERLLKFSAQTPYQLEEVMSAYIKLVSLGLDPSEEAMRSFGNTASAMGKPLEQMVEAVADAITGEFERLKEFGIKTRVEGNKVQFTFQGVKTTVKNNAADIQKYLQSLGNTKFTGAMEAQMKTLNGVFSNFKDSVSRALSIVGDELSVSLKIKEFTQQLSDAIGNLAEQFKALPQPIQDFIIEGGLVVALIGPLLLLIGQFTMGLGMTIIGITKLSGAIVVLSGFLFRTLLPAIFSATVAIVNLGLAFMATPLGWITAGIAALAVAAYLIIQNWDKVKAFWSDLWDGITKRVEEAYAYISPLIDAIASGLSLLTDNAVTRAIGSATNYVVDSVTSPNDLSMPAQKVDAGGELRIVIDENRRAQVSSVIMNTPGINTTVDQGIIMGGGL